MKHKPQVHLTPEELLAKARRQEEFVAKMHFIKASFFPALTKATTSIDDAIQNLTIINTIILEKFLARMKDIKMKDIDIYTNLSKDDPQYEGLKAMLELFDDYSVFDAKEMFEGLKQEIQLFLQEEQKERTLDTLRTKWIDEINDPDHPH